MIAVRLDDPRFPAGPATVLAEVDTVDAYYAIVRDRDGATLEGARLWTGSFPVGSRVQLWTDYSDGVSVTRVKNTC